MTLAPLSTTCVASHGAPSCADLGLPRVTWCAACLRRWDAGRGPAQAAREVVEAIAAATPTLKRAAWAFGCARRASDEEAALLEVLLQRVDEERERRRAEGRVG